MKQKAIAILLAGTMIASLNGCGGSSTSATTAAKAAAGSSGQTTQAAQKTSAEAGTEKAKTTAAAASGGAVRIIANVTGGKDEAEMKKFEEALSKATGLTVTIEKPASDYDKVLMQKLNGGEKYDLIYVTANQYMDLAKQGALTDITSQVKASSVLSQNVDQKEWDDITINGKVYAGFNKKEVHRVVQLNNAMLKKAGIDYKSIEPTLDGYYNVFKKLKSSITGQDFYPLNAVLSEAYDLQPWMASLGIKDGVVVDSDGKKYVPCARDNAAPVWEWLKKLYDEGLLDPSSFVDKTKDMRTKMEAASNKTAVTVDWAAWVGLHNSHALAGGVAADAYEIVSLPGTKTPDGSYKLVKGNASLFAVPANAQNVKGAIKVLEYFASQEGGNLLSAGIAGYDYSGTEGSYKLTDIGSQHACDHGAPFPIDKNYKPLFPYAAGVEEAMSYGKYATINTIIPNETTYKEIVGKWGIKIIKGEANTKDGLSGMRKELIDRKVSEKE
jgi:putative aldouronate transport system substrate-binding protein